MKHAVWGNYDLQPELFADFVRAEICDEFLVGLLGEVGFHKGFERHHLDQAGDRTVNDAPYLPTDAIRAT